MAETLKTRKIEIRKIGDALAVILPKEIAAGLKVEEGDELFVTGGSAGITLTSHDPDFAEAMHDADEFLHAHQDAFRKLAGK